MEKIDCIMLVDDDQTTNYINELLIEELDITNKLLIALNGMEALKLIKQHCESLGKCPSLILLDVNMPVMNGFEFMQAYKKLDVSQQQSMIVVMLTTSLNTKDVAKAKELGISSYLNKPLSEEDMRSVVKKYFSLPEG
jgi:CheY-like chemotaxis protein